MTEQYARFVETAKQIEAEDAKERFEEAMKRILSKRPHESDRKDHESKQN